MQENKEEQLEGELLDEILFEEAVKETKVVKPMLCLHCSDPIKELRKWKGKWFQACDDLCCHDLHNALKTDKALQELGLKWETSIVVEPEFVSLIPVNF